MGSLYLLIVPIWLFSATIHGATGAGPACGNERYEDFFKIQYEKEKAEHERQKYAGEVKIERAHEAKKMDEARRTYRREKKVDDVTLEKAWLEQQKVEKAKQEERRKLYVRERDREESSACHALKIPELQEYDLQDY